MLLGVSALLLFFRWINLRDSLQALRRMDTVLFAWTCVLGIVGTTIRGFRFYVLASAVEAPVTVTQSVLANYAASLLAIVTPARVGEGGKVLFFVNRQTSQAPSDGAAHGKALAAGFVFEKLADFGLLLLAGAYGATVFRRYVSVLLILAALLALGVVLLLNLERILNLVLRTPPIPMGPDGTHNGWLWATARRIPARSWASFCVYTVVIWFLGILAQVIGARALGLSVPIPLMIQVSALSVIAGTLSGTPSGIGTSQWVFTTLLAQVLEMDRAAVGALSLLLLVAAYLTALLQGSVGLALYRLLARRLRWAPRPTVSQPTLTRPDQVSRPNMDRSDE
jgi:uncharacterized membrane protein YbhN (UPF0104 family)